MTSYVPADLRRIVESQADRRCEYCLIHEEDDTYLGCQVDHVIAEKHGGSTSEDNLCYACTYCNRLKGSDIGSVASGTGKFTRFFNPRTDDWTDHFTVSGARIDTLTAIGEVAARILGFNDADRLFERQAIHVAGQYPPLGY